jgi:hypothetical protein
MRIKKVKGLIALPSLRYGKPVMHETTLTARLTVDKVGKTLSLADESRGIMLAVALEDLEDWLKVRVKEC